MYVDFIEFQGGECYRCTICAGNPDFLSLSDAIKHENTPGHVPARRHLDRAPPPVALGPRFDHGEDVAEHVPNLPNFDTAGPVEQLSESLPAPSGTSVGDSAHTAQPDWHTLMDRWSSLPNAHFTVPGPALPSDPSSTVYDLFGAATDKWEESSDEGDENDPRVTHPETPEPFRHYFEELASPPPSPAPETPTFDPRCNEDAQEESDLLQIELPEAPENSWPFSGLQEELFCLMTAFPRAVFSKKELDVVRWFSAKCNLPGMPTQSTVQTRFENLTKLLGLESRLVQSKLGNYFAVNSLSSILKNEMANPLVRKDLVFFPQDGGKSMNRAANGRRWMEEVDASLAAPMVRKSLPFGHQDYFVHEPILASVAQTEGSSTIVPQAFMPTQFFQREDNLFARSHPLLPHDSGYVIDGDTHVELPLSSFLLPFPEFLSEHERYNLPSPDIIFGVRSASHPDRLQPWTEPLENPWRKKASGKVVRSMPIQLFCDDTSGNTSKKWNKHNSFLFTLAGLPCEQAQIPYNVHFLATSNIASPLEMLEAITEQLGEARNDGIVTYDCELGEDVIAVPWVYALQGDNPMQSELCSHIGMGGKFFCRVCHVRGKDKDRGKDDDGEIQRVAEFMQTLPSLQQQEAIAQRGTFSTIDDEASKTGVKDKYFSLFLSVMKEQRDKQRGSSSESGADFLQKLRQHMPERLFNPALFIPDLDANQDTPVEILHVILLGIVKYFWRDAVAHQTTEGKEILKARIDSLDVTGLGLDPLRGTALVQYAKSLFG
ncbi:hypothetical protein FS749_008794 [Ceratobasidium sp. UAMH 11750]|nr:hypothetical protein FS749_008794 [Ceratobasidium sp. UAMH 11750]